MLVKRSSIENEGISARSSTRCHNRPSLDPPKGTTWGYYHKQQWPSTFPKLFISSCFRPPSIAQPSCSSPAAQGPVAHGSVASGPSCRRSGSSSTRQNPKIAQHHHSPTMQLKISVERRVSFNF